MRAITVLSKQARKGFAATARTVKPAAPALSSSGVRTFAIQTTSWEGAVDSVMDTLDTTPYHEKIWERVAVLDVDPEECNLGEASGDVTPNNTQIFHNSPPALLYEHAMRYEPGSHIVASGALAVLSGKKTGRSPKDKRVVEEECSVDNIWWGKVNHPLSLKSFLSNRERAVDYLNLQERLYVVDAWAGWEPAYRLPIRIITSRAYHALFMQNMLVPITPEDQAEFEQQKPFLILNAGCFPCNRFTPGMSSATSVALSFERGEAKVDDKHPIVLIAQAH